MIPEARAAERLADLLARFLEPQWLTDECLRAVAAKAIAHRVAIRTLFDELDADPAKLPLPDAVRRRQRVNDPAEVDAAWSDAGEARRAADEAEAFAASLSRGHRDDFSPDDVALARADAREREAAQDEAARAGAPRL